MRRSTEMRRSTVTLGRAETLSWTAILAIATSHNLCQTEVNLAQQSASVAAAAGEAEAALHCNEAVAA